MTKRNPTRLRLTDAAQVKFAAGEGASAARKFQMTAYTGAAVDGGWFGKLIIDMNGMKIGSQKKPILRQHDPERIAGFSEAITKDGTLEISGTLSNATEAGQEVAKLADEGFPWQASVGIGINKTRTLAEGETATVNGVELSGPALIVTSSTLKESSFVPLGADGATSGVVLSDSAGDIDVSIHNPEPEESPRGEAPKAELQQESPAMPDPIQPTATPAPAATPVVPTSANLAGSDLKPLNDLAVQRYINEGRAIGAKEEREVQRDRIDRIVALCDGRPAMALAAIRDGQSVEAVKLSVEAVKQAEAIAQKQIEELQARNLRAEQLLAIGGVSGGVSASLAAAGVDLDSPVDPKMRAETEWDRNPDLRNKFSSKDRYVAIRVAELSGKFRIKSA